MAAEADVTFALVSSDLGDKLEVVCELLDTRAIPIVIATTTTSPNAGHLNVVGNGEDVVTAIEKALVSENVANDGFSPEMLRVYRQLLRADERIKRQNTVIDRLHRHGHAKDQAETLLRMMVDARTNLEQYSKLLAATTSPTMGGE